MTRCTDPGRFRSRLKPNNTAVFGGGGHLGGVAVALAVSLESHAKAKKGISVAGDVDTYLIKMQGKQFHNRIKNTV